MKLSETLHTRIAETKTEIAGLETRLKDLFAEKQAVLGAAVVDSKALQRVEQEEATLPLKIESLRSRAALIGTQVQEALRTEAHERVHEIEGEQSAIAGRINERRTAFLKGVDELLALIRADYPERQRAAELQAESGFLHEAFGAPWPHAPTATALNSNDLLKLEAEFRKHGWLRDAGHTWREKTNALVAERSRAERTALVGQRSRGRMVTSRPAPFTMGKNA